MIVFPVVFHQICAGTLKTASRSRFRIFLVSSRGGEGGSNKKVERFDTFSVRFLNSFFLLKLFSGMCYLLLPRYHLHFFPNYRGAGRDQFKSWEFWRFFRCVFLTPFFFLSCFPICVICYSLATTRIFSRTTEEQGGTNLRVESFDFCFSVRFLNSFFLLKLFPGMCCLFFLTHHPHFSQTTGEQGRTNWRVESFDTFSVSFLESFFLLNLFSCMRYLLLLAYYPQFSLISDYLSLTTVYLPLPKYFF